MASLKDLSKEQKLAACIFLEEYEKTIPLINKHWIDPLTFYTRFGVGKIDIDEFRKSIEQEDKFSYSINILKQANNNRLFTTLLDSCYLMLQDILPVVSSEKNLEEYNKLRELFKNEFGYNRIPISEALI